MVTLKVECSDRRYLDTFLRLALLFFLLVSCCFAHCCYGGSRHLDQVDKFKMALKTVDVTFQNLDSSEISLTDVSHYYDSDPTKVVSSLRDDKKKPSSFMADTTTANAQVTGTRSPPPNPSSCPPYFSPYCIICVRVCVNPIRGRYCR